LALFGWAIDNPLLKGVDPSFVAMKPNTAVGTALLGVALMLLGHQRRGKGSRRAVLLLSAVVVGFGMVALTEYTWQVDLGLNELLFRDDPDAVETSSPGRMAMVTGFCFVVMAVAIGLSATNHRSSRRLSNVLLLLGWAIALFVILGYFYDSADLRHVGMYGAMALNTAFAFLVICTGALILLKSDGVVGLLFSGSPVGAMLRWTLPATILVLGLIGRVLTAGQSSGIFSPGVGVALTTVLTISFLLALTLTGAAVLERSYERNRRIERAARENDLRLRALLDATHVSVYVTDRQGRFVYTNQHADDLQGLGRGAMIGKTLYDFHPPERAKVYRANNERVWSCGQAVEVEETATIPGGTKTYLSQKFPIRDEKGTMIAIGGISHDITERKEMEEALRDSEERLQLALKAGNIGIWEWKIRTNTSVWSDETRRMFGIGPTEAVDFARAFEMIHPDDQESVRRALDDALVHGPSSAVEYRICRSDGAIRHVSTQGRVYKDATGTPSRLVGITVDITEHHEAQDKIGQLNDQLLRQNFQLSAANKELEAFSYSVSHDLRAPLRSIDGFSQALVEDYGDRLEAVGKDYLRRVRTAAQRMAALIDDLLRLSRVTRAEMNFEPVDLSATANAIVGRLRDKEPDRLVEVSISDGLVSRADPHLVEVVLQNLLDNAWKFTSRTARPAIRLGALVEGDDTIYFVEDNGAGFDMAYVGKLFGAFQRLHTVDEFDGTGIGLATVKRIVNRHGGDAWAQGAINTGATFYFTLEPRKSAGADDGRQNNSVGRGQSRRRGLDLESLEAESHH
jgi:PAS domain S-box-containing protein